jgi:multidrug efflux pump subunit AcrB
MSNGRFNLSALAVRERSITLFLIFLISIAGIFAFFELGRAEDPPFTIKQMTVITAWPGATAQEMQDQVADPWRSAYRNCAGMIALKPSRGPVWR